MRGAKKGVNACGMTVGILIEDVGVLLECQVSWL